MKRILLTISLLLSLAMLASAGASAAEVSVVDPWVRLVPPASHASAAYLTLKNDGDHDVSVIGVSSDAATGSDLHGMRMNEGRMVMFRVESVVVPAHGRFSLVPGGMHIMLMGLKQPLKPGQAVDIVLYLSDGSSLPVQAPVRDMRPGGMHMH